MKDKRRIKQVLKRAQEIDAKFVAFVSPSQYKLEPVYFGSAQALDDYIHRVGRHLCSEVYDIQSDWDTQLNESRAWNTIGK
jgi:hypothetical protein